MSKINLGILGGGQLGSMLATAAKKLNVQTSFIVMMKTHLHKNLLIISFWEIIMMRIKFQNL